MPTPTKAPGNFCWIELMTSDPEAAKKFYGAVFGWTAEDTPMGEGLPPYTMFNLPGEQTVGAMYKLDADQEKMGVPPNWCSYVSVDSADDAAAKVKSLGGNVVLEPFDVMEHGRMAVVQDPLGATFCVWQPKAHWGADVVGEVGSFCWWELQTNDTTKSKEFYTNLFGWSTGGGDNNYTEWNRGTRETSFGGMMEIQPEWGPVPPNWQPYVMVTDADASAELIKANGGKVLMGPMDIPNTGRFAVVQDPQGAVFNIYQSASQN